MNLDLLVVYLAEWLIYAANVAAPYAAFIAAFSGLAWGHTGDDKPRTQSAWAGLTIAAATVGPVAWFFLPPLVEWLAFIQVEMPHWQGVAHLVGAIAGGLVYMAWMRWGVPAANAISHKLTRRTTVERNRRTDVREIGSHLPESRKDFDPSKHISANPQKKGVFVGLDEQNKPVYVPYEKWRKSHIQVIGTTGAGKGVASAVLLAQALRAGESVIVLDPKNDEWAPHVLRTEAERAGVPFHLIDLNRKTPQLDFMADMTSEQLEELFIAGFSLAEKGEAADFYRIADRRAARNASGYVGECDSVEALALLKEVRSMAEDAASFSGKLEELALLDAINAPGGLNLAEVIAEGGCVYVVGSMRHSRVIMAQRMLLVRLIQLAESRDRVAGPVRPVCVFLDEFKYHISRPALEGLGAARDKGMHLVMAHQSRADLQDCPADLNPDAVTGAVVENAALRIAYRVQDPDTAAWLAQMSGEILVDDEVRRVERNAAGSEVMEHDRTVRQAQRFLIDQNMLLNLPDRTAVLFGAGLPQFAHICPIPTEKKPLTVHKAPVTAPHSDPETELAPERPTEGEQGASQTSALPTPKKAPSEPHREPKKSAVKKDLAARTIDLEDLDDVDF
ncbi:TPA: type IV secretory system conjugative DNA transfer family protein [Vibrio vulnificus]|nr:type IV secretory system conjugative DNA transfer family protein [Vibrio vulnificus]